MKLLMDLTLNAATLDGVLLVPTKAFFKPVLVISGPATPEEARSSAGSPTSRRVYLKKRRPANRWR